MSTTSTDEATRIDRAATVPAEQAGMRLDKAAATLLPEFSRTQLTAWIKSGALTVDGAPRAASTRLHGGERLALVAALPRAARWESPQSVAFGIVYEDDDLIVVDKPAGLVVHPGAGNPERTLLNGLLRHRPSLAALPRAGIVHRLDKDTAGLLVVAASAAAQRRLARDIARHRVVRRYVAVVEGVLTGGRDIDRPIGRDPHNRLKQRIAEGGRVARTRVRVQERFRAATAIVAELETGRTHQIRVHLASIGHPLVGDRRYGARGRLPPRPTERLIAVVRAFRRQALHATALELEHPTTSEPLAFASALPDDLTELLSALREDRDSA